MENNIFGPLGNEKYTEYVRDIRASAFHLLDLVGDILDTSAIESGECAALPSDHHPVPPA